ncbi:MAG TPA: hypothetical protein VMC07_00460 [Candidatus Omnitrophota bacterium]|nr:hypothetical protein [Candidatus Omnitrophota bacterium]
MDKNKNLLTTSKTLMIILIFCQIAVYIVDLTYSQTGGTSYLFLQILSVIGNLSSFLFYVVILLIIIYLIKKEK